jgi:hypothetical protein
MLHRNDSNFPKRTGEMKLQGRFSFAYFSFIKAIHGFYLKRQLCCAKLRSCNFVNNQRKVRPAAGKTF